jgi:hypothetical protein
MHEKMMMDLAPYRLWRNINRCLIPRYRQRKWIQDIAMKHHHPHERPQRSSRPKWILLGFLAIGAFFLLTEHRAHLFGILPYLLLLSCLLMHVFHGHGGHDGNETGEAPAVGPASQPHDNGGKQS